MPDKDKSFIETALERFRIVETAERDARQGFLDDLKFEWGDQWPEEIKNEREREGRPFMTINRTRQMVFQVTNEQRQNRVSIDVIPHDSQSDPKTAEVIRDYIRQVEIESDADIHYSNQFCYAVKGGWGFLRVLTEYEEGETFQKRIRIRGVENPLQVYLDPNAQEPDRSDARWAFIVTDLPIEEYKALYGEDDLMALDALSSQGTSRSEGWKTETTVRVAEYFHEAITETKIFFVEDPEKKNRQVINQAQKDTKLFEDWTVLEQRTVRSRKIKWSLINGVTELDSTDWEGSTIPIVPIFGEVVNIDGKREIKGMVRDMKDPARSLNYNVTNQAETIALAPKAPVIVAEGQIEGHEDEWSEANRKNQAYLAYKETTASGHLVPPPQRNVLEPPIQAITLAIGVAGDNLKSASGIYDSALGNRSNETSGIAIRQRQRESGTANFHLIDNHNKALRRVGEIIVELIPRVETRERLARLTGLMDENRTELIANEPNGQSVMQKKTAEGIKRVFNVGVGRYDVHTTVGPSHMTQRQDSADSLLALAQAWPDLMNKAGHVVMKFQDIQGADEIASILKRSMSPQLLDESDDSPEAMKIKMTLMAQQIAALTQELNKKVEEIETDEVSEKSKERRELARLASQETIARLNAEVKLELAGMETRSREAIAELTNSIKAIDSQIRALTPRPPAEPPVNAQTIGGA